MAEQTLETSVIENLLSIIWITYYVMSGAITGDIEGCTNYFFVNGVLLFSVTVRK